MGFSLLEDEGVVEVVFLDELDALGGAAHNLGAVGLVERFLHFEFLKAQELVEMPEVLFPFTVWPLHDNNNK